MKLKEKQNQNATMFKHSSVDELFNLVKTKEGVIICVGKFKVSTKKFRTYGEAETYIATKPYEILINVSVLMCKLNLENNEKENNAVQQETETK